MSEPYLASPNMYNLQVSLCRVKIILKALEKWLSH